MTMKLRVVGRFSGLVVVLKGCTYSSTTVILGRNARYEQEDGRGKGRTLVPLAYLYYTMLGRALSVSQ
jgi:hypothetical protein